MRGIYGRFDSKSNRTADSIRDSIRTQKNDSQVPSREYVTPVLMQLHRLPMQQRIEFKLAVLVYTALKGWSLQHLADDECRGHLLKVLCHVCKKLIKKI